MCTPWDQEANLPQVLIQGSSPIIWIAVHILALLPLARAWFLRAHLQYRGLKPGASFPYRASSPSPPSRAVVFCEALEGCRAGQTVKVLCPFHSKWSQPTLWLWCLLRCLCHYLISWHSTSSLIYMCASLWKWRSVFSVYVFTLLYLAWHLPSFPAC